MLRIQRGKQLHISVYLIKKKRKKKKPGSQAFLGYWHLYLSTLQKWFQSPQAFRFQYTQTTHWVSANTQPKSLYIFLWHGGSVDTPSSLQGWHPNPDTQAWPKHPRLHESVCPKQSSTQPGPGIQPKKIILASKKRSDVLLRDMG